MMRLSETEVEARGVTESRFHVAYGNMGILRCMVSDIRDGPLQAHDAKQVAVDELARSIGVLSCATDHICVL